MKNVVIIALSFICLSCFNLRGNPVEDSLWFHFTKESDSFYQKFRIGGSSYLAGLQTLIDSNILIEDSLVFAKRLEELGNCQRRVNEFDLAATNLFRSLEINKKLRNSKGVVKVYNRLAFLFYYQNNHSKSFEYLDKAKLELKSIVPKNYSLYGAMYNAKALIHYDLDQDDSAEYYFKLCLEAEKRRPDFSEKDIVVYQDNYAMLLENQGRFDEAIDIYMNSLKVHKRFNGPTYISGASNYIARCYLWQGIKDSSLKYIEFAKFMADSSHSLETQMDVSYSSTLIYSEFGVLDSIQPSLDKYYDVVQELVTINSKKNVAEMEAQYQVAQTKAEMAISEKDKERLEAQNEVQRLLMGIGVLVGAVLLIIGVLVYRSNQKKRLLAEQKRELAELKLDVKEGEMAKVLADQETDLYASLLKGQNEERERVAQELHDRLGGTLSALKMSLNKEGKAVSKEDMEIVSDAVKEVRSISHNLSTGIVSEYGFNQAVEKLAARMKTTANLDFELELDEHVNQLGQTKGIELYRIVQELLANTLKHADAKEVSIHSNFHEGSFNLIFEDDGKGFDMKSKNGKWGIGLSNIQKRVERINGSLNIDSALGRGTIAIVELNSEA